MHAVYKVTFNDRIERNDPPFYYIGSCANYRYENNILYNRLNHIYWGSSGYIGYKEICKIDNPIVEILYSFKNYKDATAKERELHLLYDVVRDYQYFNLRNANDKTNYHELGYSYYIHKITGKRIRLKTDDLMVLDGTYIHFRKGTKLSENNLITIKNGYDNFKNNKVAYESHCNKKSNNMKEYWEHNRDKRIEQMKNGYTQDVRDTISSKLKLHYSTLDNDGKLLLSERCKQMHLNMSDEEKVNRGNKISSSLNTSEKFKNYTDSQKEKRKGGNNPSATRVFWDGLIFNTLKEFNIYIKENGLHKTNCHDIVKNNPTKDRYIIRRSDINKVN